MSYTVPDTYADSGVAKSTVKIQRRKEVIDLFSVIPGHPVFVTFPGSTWVTELEIIKKREALELPAARFLCFESHLCTYMKSIMAMPGEVKSVKKDRVAKEYGQTRFILHKGSMEDFQPDKNYKIDAAWIDYTGQLTDQRISYLREELWPKVTRYLVLTSMASRWKGNVREEILTSSLPQFLKQEFKQAKFLQSNYYQSKKAPMYQVTLEKTYD